MSGNLELPSILQIEVTSHCNLRCKMCPLTTHGTLSSIVAGHMAEDTWQRTLAAAKIVGKAMVSGYGEPLTNPRYLSHLRDLDAAGIWTSMSTNGVALTPRVGEQLAATRHLFHINISIDSPDPALYREARGGDLNRALNGLRNLMSAVDDPQRVTVSSVLMKRNLPSLAEMPGILGPLRVPKYILQGLITLNSDGQEQRLDELRDAKVSIERIKAASAQNGVELVLTMPDQLDRELSDAPVPAIQPASSASPAPESRQCGIPWELAFVDKDGLVFPCCYASALRADALGNLREEGFVDIWQGDRYQHFRQRLVEGDLPDCCRGCDAAPPGEHPLRRYAAELVLEESDLEGEHEVRAVFRNRGTVTWDQSSRVRIGTASPRDGASAYHHPTWIAPHRVTTFLEERVPPGESGTFSFRIAPQLRHASENFQLMVEDVAWLPGTTFQVQPRRSLATRLVLATQPVARAYHRARRFSVREAIRTRTLSR